MRTQNKYERKVFILAVFMTVSNQVDMLVLVGFVFRAPLHMFRFTHAHSQVFMLPLTVISETRYSRSHIERQHLF